MPRVRISALQQAELVEAEREEKVRLAAIKIGSSMLKIDELAKRCKDEVDSQIKFIRETTDKKLLEMKWSDFMALKIDHFAEHQVEVPRTPAARTRCVSQHRGRIRTKQQTWTRVQSVDRAGKDEAATDSFLRWPRAGELVFSKAGSPLAVQNPSERLANVHIPTSKGVATVKPNKLGQVEREVLMTLDRNTLNQVKTLNANLAKIVDMAGKMGKPS